MKTTLFVKNNNNNRKGKPSMSAQASGLNGQDSGPAVTPCVISRVLPFVPLDIQQNADPNPLYPVAQTIPPCVQALEVDPFTKNAKALEQHVMQSWIQEIDMLTAGTELSPQKRVEEWIDRLTAVKVTDDQADLFGVDLSAIHIPTLADRIKSGEAEVMIYSAMAMKVPTNLNTDQGLACQFDPKYLLDTKAFDEHLKAIEARAKRDVLGGGDAVVHEVTTLYQRLATETLLGGYREQVLNVGEKVRAPKFDAEKGEGYPIFIHVPTRRNKFASNMNAFNGDITLKLALPYSPNMDGPPTLDPVHEKLAAVAKMYAQRLAPVTEKLQQALNEHVYNDNPAELVTEIGLDPVDVIGLGLMTTAPRTNNRSKREAKEEEDDSKASVAEGCYVFSPKIDENTQLFLRCGAKNPQVFALDTTNLFTCEESEDRAVMKDNIHRMELARNKFFQTLIPAGALTETIVQLTGVCWYTNKNRKVGPNKLFMRLTFRTAAAVVMHPNDQPSKAMAQLMMNPHGLPARSDLREYLSVIHPVIRKWMETRRDAISAKQAVAYEKKIADQKEQLKQLEASMLGACNQEYGIELEQEHKAAAAELKKLEEKKAATKMSLDKTDPGLATLVGKAIAASAANNSANKRKESEVTPVTDLIDIEAGVAKKKNKKKQKTSAAEVMDVDVDEEDVDITTPINKKKSNRK